MSFDTSKDAPRGKRIPFERSKIEYRRQIHLDMLQNPAFARRLVFQAAKHQGLHKWSNIDLTVAIFALQMQRQLELQVVKESKSNLKRWIENHSHLLEKPSL